MSRDRGRTRCDLLVKIAGLFLLVMLNNAALQTEREPIQITRENVRWRMKEQLKKEVDGAAGIGSKWKVIRKSREKRNLQNTEC